MPGRIDIIVHDNQDAKWSSRKVPACCFLRERSPWGSNIHVARTVITRRGDRRPGSYYASVNAVWSATRSSIPDRPGRGPAAITDRSGLEPEERDLLMAHGVDLALGLVEREVVDVHRDLGLRRRPSCRRRRRRAGTRRCSRRHNRGASRLWGGIPAARQPARGPRPGPRPVAPRLAPVEDLDPRACRRGGRCCRSCRSHPPRAVRPVGREGQRAGCRRSSAASGPGPRCRRPARPARRPACPKSISQTLMRPTLSPVAVSRRPSDEIAQGEQHRGEG